MTCTARDVFNERLLADWLPAFCSKRGFSVGGFVADSLGRLSECDAADFIEALDTGLVTYSKGTFLAPMSKVKEQIFWEGAKAISPRPISLWLEPVITIAVLCRLQRDHHWPAALLGLQSADWAFDLVAYDANNPTIERLVCEVKKTEAEVDALIDHMQHYLQAPEDILPGLKPAERNAFKKVIGLRKTAATTFWAAGPGKHLRTFTIEHSHTGAVSLIETDQRDQAPLVSP